MLKRMDRAIRLRLVSWECLYTLLLFILAHFGRTRVCHAIPYYCRRYSCIYIYCAIRNDMPLFVSEQFHIPSSSSLCIQYVYTVPVHDSMAYSICGGATKTECDRHLEIIQLQMMFSTFLCPTISTQDFNGTKTTGSV